MGEEQENKESEDFLKDYVLIPNILNYDTSLLRMISEFGWKVIVLAWEYSTTINDLFQQIMASRVKAKLSS